MKYIYHHLGLGDHIICNGLVRSLINPDEEYKMFVKPHNLTSVSFMYRDIKNLSFLIGDDTFAQSFIQQNNLTNEDLILAGFYKHPESNSFDESFYLQNNLKFTDRWDKFYVNRDINREEELFNYYGLGDTEYVFIHDDILRNYNIDENYVNKDLKIIRPIKGLTENIFDYCTIIKNSSESHFIDSSFRLMCDSLNLKNEDIFYHLELKDGIKRNIDNFDNSKNKLKFKII
jgi:hypothetical protein